MAADVVDQLVANRTVIERLDAKQGDFFQSGGQFRHPQLVSEFQHLAGFAIDEKSDQ